MPVQDATPVSGAIPVSPYFDLLEIRIQAIKL
jgi:hypothetical protein